MNLSILLPGLLPRTYEDQGLDTQSGRFGVIESLIAKSKFEEIAVKGYDSTLCSLFGIISDTQHDLPLGAITRYALTGEKDGENWLCADPVHLHADVNQLYLTGSRSMNITMPEARALVDMCNSHFKDQGWHIEVYDPQHWHIALPRTESLKTFPLRELLGQPINAFLPTGEHGVSWHAVMNELQMLFHRADVNRQRKARAEQVINSLWLYGAGELPDVEHTPIGTVITDVWAEELVARGLCRLADNVLHSLPRNLDAVIEHGYADDTKEATTQLVCLEELQQLAANDDFPQWQAVMADLQESWFAPLLQALRAGDLDEARLYDCAGRCFSLHRRQLWYFWRRPKSLRSVAGN